MNKTLLFAVLLVLNIEAHGKSDNEKKEAFIIQCESSFAQAGLQTIPKVSYDKVKKTGKEMCADAVTKLDKRSAWATMSEPMFLGCSLGLWSFKNSNLDSALKHLDLDKLEGMVCAGLEGR